MCKTEYYIIDIVDFCCCCCWSYLLYYILTIKNNNDSQATFLFIPYPKPCNSIVVCHIVVYETESHSAASSTWDGFPNSDKVEVFRNEASSECNDLIRNTTILSELKTEKVDDAVFFFLLRRQLLYTPKSTIKSL